MHHSKCINIEARTLLKEINTGSFPSDLVSALAMKQPKNSTMICLSWEMRSLHFHRCACCSKWIFPVYLTK